MPDLRDTSGVEVRLRLFGAVELWLGERALPLGPRQQRLVLAVLAAEVGRLVPVQRLIDLLWTEEPPKRAGQAVRVYVSQLRGLLAAAGVDPAEFAIITQGPGYLLRADPLIVDTHRFRQLLGEAREHLDDARRIELLDAALALWTGTPLGELATDELRERLFAGLIETRLVATEDRFDALLRLGRAAELIGELTELVGRHPLRERLVGQLMLANHRAGRAEAALAVFQRTTDALATELGLDPGAELRGLATTIRRVSVPAMLPPSVADFTGRGAALDELDEATSGTVVISAIAGTAGVGKTALAVRWAHQVRERFPDGQLYANLDGYALGPPIRPEQILSQFLRALGVPTDQIPVEPAAASTKFRAMLADRRMLVLLDNAGSAEQVRPLLPANPDCVVLVTSRDRLDGLVALDDARRLTLDVLPPRDAITLLGRIIGARRVAAEPQAAAELAGIAAFLPLALRIAAAHLAIDDRRRIADYLASLREGRLLDALQVPGDRTAAVRATFELSYRALEPDARRMFRLMGLTPGQDLTPTALAAMADLPVERAIALLDALAAAHLVEAHEPGRYTFHDLLRQFAAELASEVDTEAECAAARARLFDHYLHSTKSATALLYGHIVQLPAADEPPAHAVRFTEPDAALNWLRAERVNLVATVRHAAEHGPHRLAWQLADAVRGYLQKTRLFVDWLAVGRAALSVADAVAEPNGRGAAHLSLGTAYSNLSDYTQGIEHFERALALFQRGGWLLGEIGVQTNLGWLDEDFGRLDQAAERDVRIAELARAGGFPHNEGGALINLAIIEMLQGKLEESARHNQEALDLARRIQSFGNEGYALEGLGLVTALRGEHARGRELCEQAVTVFRRLTSGADEALARAYLAMTHSEAGEPEQARDIALGAVSLAMDNADRHIEAVSRCALADAHAELGDHQAAEQEYAAALAIARQAGTRYPTCAALVGRAACAIRLRPPDEAIQAATEALTEARESGYRLLEALALLARAAAFRADGDSARANTDALDALAINEATGHRRGIEQARALVTPR